ncbi:MAG: hypothetical protein KI793_34490 [Rivularia sp. (in: Bacteria)]|nr:hypothetical protein [Rivularia sp. MS3]
MLKSVEGIYKDGKIELSELPSDVTQSRVIVTFLASKPVHSNSQMISFGMFNGSNQSTEEDFKVAEFFEDVDDNLDYS